MPTVGPGTNAHAADTNSGPLQVVLLKGENWKKK